MEPMSMLATLPSLAHRPNFPNGLRVLLIDTDYQARLEAEAQLRDISYCVTPCSCAQEASALLSSPDHGVDVLLADVRCLQQKSSDNDAIFKAAKSIPLVLMSNNGTPSEVMLAIKLGAVDVLEKPLSPLKLKTIWQHLVRRMLVQPDRSAFGKKKGAASLSPADSGSAGDGHSCGFACDSGSNVSTSDQAAFKMDSDTLSELPAHQGSVGSVGVPPCQPTDGAAAMDVDDLVFEAAARAASKPRPQAVRYRANRQSLLGNTTGSSGGPKPAIGYPAGQMPPLPEGLPGIAWGLPTNPLQISIKAPMGGLMGPMGWPGGATLMSPSAMFHQAMMMGPAMAPRLEPGFGRMQCSQSCVALSTGDDAPTAFMMRRADSAPLPPTSSLALSSSGSGATAPVPGAATSPALGTAICAAAQGPPAGCAAQKPAVEPRVCEADLFFSGFDSCKPSLGLQLKKSASLLDFFSEMLERADGPPAC